MASTYSPNLRLELIGTGEQQGTWGATTNTNLGTLLEEAIGGYISVTVSDAGDTTLTTNNGSADQSRNMVINLTGTISMARNVLCPAVEKLYVVRNATTGGYAVTFKVSGQTGVTVPNGSTVFLYVNGTDAVAITGSIASQAANNVSITGGSISGLSNLSVANATVAAQVRTNLGLGTADSPQFLTVEIGNASDTTLSRSSAGVIAVEGVAVPLNSVTNTHIAQQYEIGNTTDTTLTRVSAGVAAIEGKNIALNGTGETLTTGTIELGAATDTTISRVSAGRIAVEGVNVTLETDVEGQQTIWIPAVAMYARTTNGAASGTLETTTNKVMLKTLDFDPTTQEFAQFAIQMPKSWNEGTLICQFIWSHPATTTNFGVVWGISAVALSDDEAADTAFGSVVTATDTGGTTNDIYISPDTSEMTVGSTPTADNWVVFQVQRNPADGSDTLAVDARLQGVRVKYTTDAATDS